MIYGRDADLSDRRDRIHRRRRSRRAGARRTRRHRARPRQREGARASPSAARIRSIGNLADPESFRGSADAQDGYVHAAYDSRRAAGPAIERAALETIIAAAKRPRTAGATAPATAVRHLHVGRLGARPGAGAGDRRRADQPDRARRRGVPPTSSWCSMRRPTHLRTMVVRPGVVYGGGNGIVGDIFKSAQQRPGARRRRRQQPLAARLRPRSRAISTRGWPRSDDASGVYHANDEGDERVNDIVVAIKPYLPVQPDVRHVPIEEARHQDGRRTPTRWRSIRWSAARAPARSAGRRRCIRWPATPRGCSKSGGTRMLKSKQLRVHGSQFNVQGSREPEP